MAEGIAQGGGIKRSPQAQQSILQRQEQSRGSLGVDSMEKDTAAPTLSDPCHGMGPSAPRPLAEASKLPGAFFGAKLSCVGQCPSSGKIRGSQKGRGGFGTEPHCPQCYSCHKEPVRIDMGRGDGLKLIWGLQLHGGQRC